MKASELKAALLKAEREKWEDTLAAQIKALKLPEPDRQFRFHRERKWRADFFWWKQRLIVEVDGGQWMEKSGHAGAGYERDRIRDAECILLGFTVLRVTPGMIESGVAVGYIEKILLPENGRCQKT